MVVVKGVWNFAFCGCIFNREACSKVKNDSYILICPLLLLFFIWLCWVLVVAGGLLSCGLPAP